METLLFIAIVVVAFIGYLLDDEDEDLNPLDLARPSIERLEAEAERAAEELRQLERNVRR
jgi:CHASE3 domain sensor protein